MLPSLLRSVGIVVLLFCLTGLPVKAESGNEALDRVVFVNGDVLSGRVQTANVQMVRLKNTALGEIAIPWTEIAEVRTRCSRVKIEGTSASEEFGDFQLAVLRNTASGMIVNIDDNAIAIPSSASVLFERAEHPTAGMTQLMNTEQQTTKTGSAVAVSMNAPESVVLGLQSQEVFGGSLRIRHNLPSLCGTPSWASSILAAANHNKTYKIGAPAVITDTFDGTVTSKNGFTSDSGVSRMLIADFYGNSSLGVGLQQSYGIGISGIM